MTLKDKAYHLLNDAKNSLLKGDLKSSEIILKNCNIQYPYYIESYELLLNIYNKTGQSHGYSRLKTYMEKHFNPYHPARVNFEDNILFLGLDLPENEVKRGSVIKMTYYWRCIKKINKHLAVFVHLEGDQNDCLQDDHEGQFGIKPINNHGNFTDHHPENI